MLVLTRKVGERIQIGDDVVVSVRRIEGSRVQLAIEAPREVRIVRSELEHPQECLRSAEECSTAPAGV